MADCARSAHSHKAEGAVCDEEQLLSVTDQSVEDSVGLFSSQNELIYRGMVERALLCVQQCAGSTQKEKLGTSYPDPP